MSEPTINLHVAIGDGPGMPPADVAEALRDLIVAAWSLYGATATVTVADDDPDKLARAARHVVSEYEATCRANVSPAWDAVREVADDEHGEVIYEVICTHAAGEVPEHPRYYPTPPPRHL